MKRLDVGARVHEPTYGLGSIVAVEDAFVCIQFDDSTVRKFLIRLAKLEPSSEPAPPTRSRGRKGAARKKASAKKASAKKASAKKAPAKKASAKKASSASGGA